MNTEKQLQESNRLLKELMARLSAEDPEDNKQKQEEIDELNKSIDEYETEINKLKEKLDDENNYTRSPSGFEGDNTPILEEMTTTFDGDFISLGKGGLFGMINPLEVIIDADEEELKQGLGYTVLTRTLQSLKAFSLIEMISSFQTIVSN